MNKLYVDSESYAALDKWASAHREACRRLYFVVSRIDVLLDKSDVTGHFTARRDKVKYTITDDGGMLAKGKIETDGIDNDYRISVKVNDNLEEDSIESLNHIIECISSVYIYFCAFVSVEPDNEKLRLNIKNNTDALGVSIALKSFKGQLKAVEVGKHKSPEGVFGVSGHFRHYKSGKVIWIDEYLKGTNK